MTVSALITRNDITATASQTSFAYTFRVLAATDMDVYQNGVLLSSGYTVNNVGTTTGGTVVLDTGVPVGQIVSLVLAMPLDRTTNYQNSGKFLADDVNEDFDKIYIGAIQNENLNDRSLRLQDVEPPTTGVDMTLPLKADRKGKFLAFDPTNGRPIATVGTSASDSASWVAYNFTGNGSTTAFTLGSDPATENNTQVYIDGVYQQKNGYSVAGAVLTFSVAPPNLSTIEVMVASILPIGSTVDQPTRADLVSYLPAGTGAVVTTVQTKLRETVSVKDFGAVGDGATDDTAAIQATLDSGANEVFVPEGTYIHNSLTMSVSATKLSLSKNAILKLKASSTGAQITISATDCAITGGELNGNRANNTTKRAVNVTSGGSGALVRGVKITSVSGEGLYATDADRVTFENNYITDTFYTGIATLGLSRSYTDLKVINNNVDRTGENDSTGVLGGIQVYGASSYKAKGIIIVNNYIIMNRNGVLATPFVAIETKNTEDLVIDGNVTINSYMGISATKGFNTVISNNSSTNANFAGIESANNTGNISISGNAIDGDASATTGMSITGSVTEVGKINISGNILGNFTNRCIYISGLSTGKEINITGNTLSLSAICNGIQLNKCEDILISGNYIGYQTSTDKVGVSIETSSKININGNNLKNCRITIFATSAVTLNDILIANNYIDTSGTGLLQSLSGGASLGSNCKVIGNIGSSSTISYDYFDLLNKRFKGVGAIGTPQGTVIAGIGSEWINTVGGVGTTLYVKESGTGNTGWAAK